jgi:geranylgeranyl diphosphate synthase type II
LGKTPGKDARSQKATYPSLYGIEATRLRASVVHEAACAALNRLQRPTTLLDSIADFILQRNA